MENIKALIQEAEELIAQDIAEGLMDDETEMMEAEETRKLLATVFGK